MEKISGINFFPFVVLWRILKEKFSDHLIELNDNNGVRYILIRSMSESKYPKNGELVLEIHDPFAWDNMPEGGYDNVDLNEKTIKVVLSVWNPYCFVEFFIEQSLLDEDVFILRLKLIVGKIAPILANKDCLEWLRDQFLTLGIE
ncbi:MAG: hypothetical protein WCI93_00845 [bacterium]